MAFYSFTSIKSASPEAAATAVHRFCKRHRSEMAPDSSDARPVLPMESRERLQTFVDAVEGRLVHVTSASASTKKAGQEKSSKKKKKKKAMNKGATPQEG